MQRRLKKSVVYSLYGFSLVFLLVGFLILGSNKKADGGSLTDYDYAYNILNKMILPVMEESNNTIIRPYSVDNMEIVTNYYDYQGDSQEQEKSLILYQDTYMQNDGINYSNGDTFDVLSVIDGEVTKVEESDLLGNIIEITKDNITSRYQSLSEIAVKKGDKVTQGSVIAKSGTSNISPDLKNHLHFELLIDGVTVNPEEYYDKAL